MEDSFAKGTDIDRRTCTRVVPMRVICTGLPKTGTTSLRAALQRLGYEQTYHMESAAYENIRDCEMWLDAFRAKYDGIGTFEKEDWDKLLGHCQAVTDVPAALFIPELVKAYPDAKVVMNTRDVDAWYTSTTNTIVAALSNIDNVKTGGFEPDHLKAIRKELLTKVWQTSFPDGFKETGKEAFHKHNEMVRQTVRKDNLLEYSVKEGWEPLCKFLEVPVPDEPFPRLNDRASYWQKMTKKFGLKIPEPQKIEFEQQTTTSCVV
ncbi:conserved hypothetical protein [Uncinocarpus reesii 1704]|uniref:NAD dependent epimerase/dehydratase n=1 Tax=Uncinocarpus reesii (strain UAMH 1704) TaxID=336963 RepID=C4JU25_UNCRE|nr:uncharacterized protein UREG_05964 [Uncinocarpus reesii 1704]EEP81122.1 conserved hypothetical protein [Uncinocarpus reesii 1704]